MLPKAPIGETVSDLVDFIETHLGWLLDHITLALRVVLNGFQEILMAIPPLVFIPVITVIIYFIGHRDLRLALVSAAGLLLIWNLQLWELAMMTLALVISSTFIALLFGIPIGILAAGHDSFNAFVRVLLDLMQTMPPFVYLIPAVIFFSLGNVPGMIATVIFAMPPAIRLTNLGIRQIPTELIEVAEAFGATPRQKLLKVQLPGALPTIMTGVNQCIMLALSMVVISSMIGAAGLGYQVLVGIQRVDIAMGFEAGLAIVVLAIILDRVTQSIVR